MAKDNANPSTENETSVDETTNAPETGAASTTDAPVEGSQNDQGAVQDSSDKNDNVLEPKAPTAAEERAAVDTAQAAGRLVAPPSAPLPAEEGEEMITIVLNTEFRTNRVSYGPGQVTVPKHIADDLLRRHEYWNKAEAFRHDGGDYTVKEAVASLDAAGK